MAARAVTTIRPDAPRLNPALTKLLHASLLATVVVWLFVAGWLLLRRIGGELQQPLGFPTLVLVGVALAALASLLRVVWYQTGLRPRRWQSLATLLWLSSSCAVASLAVALSITGTGTIALVVFWGILLLSEGVWCRIAWRLVRSAGAAAAPRPTPPPAAVALAEDATTTGDAASIAATLERHGEADEENDEQLPDDVCQQLTRAAGRRGYRHGRRAVASPL